MINKSFDKFESLYEHNEAFTMQTAYSIIFQITIYKHRITANCINYSNY